MDNFEEKVFSLNSKLAQITPKIRSKQQEYEEMVENFSHQKQSTEKLLKQWESRVKFIQVSIEELFMSLNVLKAEKQKRQGFQGEKSQNSVEQFYKEHDKALRQAEKQLNQSYCHLTEQITSQTKNVNLQIKQMRGQIEREIKNVKKILKDGSLSLKYDKNFHKKLQTIKNNEEKKKRRIKEVRNNIEERVRNIEEKLHQKLTKSRKASKVKDQKIKKLLKLLTQLL